MKIYVAVCWCDGFGNDEYIHGIYSTLEKAVNEFVKRPKEERYERIRIVETEVDEEMNFDFYELRYNFEKVYNGAGKRIIVHR